MAEKAQTEQKLTLEKFEQAYEIVKKRETLFLKLSLVNICIIK